MQNKKRAFTLVELMIVIAVIGILAAMALPNFNQAREKARKMKCWEYTSLANRTSELYYIDNNKYPDKIEDMGNYLRGDKNFKCPSGGAFLPLTGTGEGTGIPKMFTCSFHQNADSTWGG